MNEFDIVCIGNICADLRIIVEKYPRENDKIRTDEPYEISCGGPAATASVVGAKFGLNTAFIGVVSDDTFGNSIVNELKNNNVNTDHIEMITDPNIKTALGVVTVSKANASRTIEGYHAKAKISNQKNIKAKVLEFDGQELEASLKAIEDNPEAVSILDAGRDKEENTILGKKVDYLICSKDYAEAFVERVTGRETGSFHLDNEDAIAEAYEVMSKTFDNNIIITLEEKGCVYKNGNDINLVPTIKVKPVDTTGAGDIFHGAFAYCMAMGYDLFTALKFSNIVASLSVTKRGGITSIPNLSEVEESWVASDIKAITLKQKEKIR